MISLANKITCLFLGFVLTFPLCGQNVIYYRLHRTVINGVSSTDVSGGQFITFIGDICFESDKSGVGVSHGQMKKNTSYSETSYSIYQGDSYWGSSATFKFNADKSVLNVILDNGSIYVYKKAIAPAGVETCSLLKKENSNGGSHIAAGSVAPGFPVSDGGTFTGTSQSMTTEKDRQNTQNSRYGYKECHLCRGSGVCQTCNGKGWYYGFTSDPIKCPNCDSNQNGKCSICHGKGTVYGLLLN